MKSKKLLSLLLALAMVMSMAACGAKTNEPPATSDRKSTRLNSSHSSQSRMPSSA